jgi:hypothetical protein
VTSTRRDAALGVVATALGVAAMAVDHLLGDDPGLEDPPAFAFSAALVLAVAAVVFGLVVPRRIEAAPARAIALAALAVVTLPLVFLGVPFPLAAAAVALGLRGRADGSRLATAAVAVGALVLALVTVGYAAQAVQKLT